MASDRPLGGIFAPVTTPFRGEEIDPAAFTSNLRHYASTALAGIVVLGSNGEAPLLDDDESDALIETSRGVWPDGKWLIAGTGRESLRATIAATARAAARGVDAVMVRTPSFYKARVNADAMVAFYTAVADASPVPVILYNVTMFTGVNLAPDTAARLSAHPNIIGIKDSGGDVTVICGFSWPHAVPASPSWRARRARFTRPSSWARPARRLAPRTSRQTSARP